MRKESDNSKIVLAVILIVVGGLWLLKQLGIYIDLPHFHDILFPLRNAFHNFWHFIFSWPTLLIIIGLVLLAGKRSSGGIILIVIGGVFLIPKIFFILGVTAALLLPIVLIGIGIALVARII